MENKELYQQFRRTVEKSAWLMIFLIFLIECIVAVIFVQNQLIDQSDSPLSYSLTYVVLPTLINMECVGIFHYVEYKTKLKDHIKNLVLVISFNIICLTSALVHNALHLITLGCILPVFLSAIFGDKKMTRCTFIMSLVSYVIAMINGIYYTQNRNYLVYLDYISGMLLMWAGYLVARSVIDYELKNREKLIQFNHRQQEMIEEMKKDSLTKLYNHNTLYDILNDNIKDCLKEYKPLALAILDIDNFKKVNDTFGHVKGDQVLVRLSELMKTYQTDEMILARYGGEEFCIVFIGIEIKEAYAILEEMRLKFSELIFHDIGDTKITFSAGLVEFCDDADNGTALVEKADQAMYEAKNAGKNKIVLYQSKK